MNVAYNLTRREMHYRHDAFSAGLRAAGYAMPGGGPVAAPGNVLLIWNRYGMHHDQACSFERGGGTVLVAENGYIGAGGVSPHHMAIRDPYALARGYHNDATCIPEGSGDRWDALGVALAPWRATGEHVLVCPNRAFGTPGRAMPPDWGNDVRRRLSKLTKREIRVRPHPGNDAPRKPLADDLRNCWAVVIWSSSAGVHALVAGIPVFQEAPAWIATSPASLNLKMIEDPAMDDYRRLAGMHRLAHGQYSLAEIESGEAFRRVLA